MQFNQKDSRKQIKDILAATNSVEQHVYLEKGQLPNKIQSYATKSNRNLAEEEQLREFMKNKQVSTASGIPKGTVDG